MRERWFVFDGISVFDHETKQFWDRNQIKERALTMWKNCEMPKKNPDNSDLTWLFRQEFDQYTDIETCTHKLWDELGHWEMIETPHNIGFGIIDGDCERFSELVKIHRGG